jgi:hypothetical protein
MDSTKRLGSQITNHEILLGFDRANTTQPHLNFSAMFSTQIHGNLSNITDKPNEKKATSAIGF